MSKCEWSRLSILTLLPSSLGRYTNPDLQAYSPAEDSAFRARLLFDERLHIGGAGRWLVEDPKARCGPVRQVPLQLRSCLSANIKKSGYEDLQDSIV
jgi:hypothetical protein